MSAAGWKVLIIVTGIISLIYIVSLLKIFSKAGRHGWAAIIPFYNVKVLVSVSGLPNEFFWYIFVPFLNLYAIFKIFIALAGQFGKTTLYGVGCTILGFIFLPMLAFEKNNYYMSAFGDAPVMNYGMSQAGVLKPIGLTQQSNGQTMMNQQISNNGYMPNQSYPNSNQSQNTYPQQTNPGMGMPMMNNGNNNMNPTQPMMNGGNTNPTMMNPGNNNPSMMGNMNQTMNMNQNPYGGNQNGYANTNGYMINQSYPNSNQPQNAYPQQTNPGMGMPMMGQSPSGKKVCPSCHSQVDRNAPACFLCGYRF